MKRGPWWHTGAALGLFFSILVIALERHMTTLASIIVAILCLGIVLLALGVDIKAHKEVKNAPRPPGWSPPDNERDIGGEDEEANK